ncbi:phage baseplate assembly protein V [Paenibacillus profundus]|uniref:Phage baseplate assembly protein V n=1 Tax=Paenibacillus profundus TaxID=1173085 RepID=A0ABS8YP08_9BACL|nr:contractile injection system protein, VgrG/Pvc8 family [Paenibacillus profundus]MCE5173555.1 phage baseplate assembly protein V [Paenibacillus profundus]
MSVSLLSYQNVRVAPFDHMQLLELRMIQQVNEHGKLTFTGVISEEHKDNDLYAINEQTPIEVKQILEQGEERVLFSGIITEMRIEKSRDVYSIHAEALTSTVMLDIRVKSRSFQDASMNYGQLVQQIGKDYSNYDVNYTADKNPGIGNLVMQYKETDWAFLKRMASRLDTVVVPAEQFKDIKFFFGLPESGAVKKLEEFNYIVKKKLGDYMTYHKNIRSDVQETDFIFYVITTDQLLHVGDAVDFQKARLYVEKAVSTMEKGRVMHQYTITSRKGLNREQPYNDAIRGASVGGTVMAINRDKVKVQLDIDKKQDAGKAYWFPYSTVYASADGSGWYCMPEAGDSVRVTFPSQREEEAFAISSVNSYAGELPGATPQGAQGTGAGSGGGSQGGGSQDRMADPNVRYFRNSSGMEVTLAPSHVLISANNGQATIMLDQSGSVTIVGQNEVSLTSKETVNIRADKTLTMTASEEITIESQKGGKIVLNSGGDTELKGNEVFTN